MTAPNHGRRPKPPPVSSSSHGRKPKPPPVSSKSHGRRPPPPPPRGGKKSSSTARGPVAGLVYGLAAFVVLTIGSLGGYLLHGYGVLG